MLGRRPLVFIFSFVSLSILTALFIHLARERSREARAPAATGVPTTRSASEGLIDQVAEINGSMTSLADPGFGPARDCRCVEAGTESLWMKPEEEALCTIERKAWGTTLSQLPPQFSHSRHRRSSDFPEVCMIFSMNRQFPQGPRRPQSNLAKCSNPKGQPLTPALKPCVSASYVNSIYNLYSDFSTCFGMSGKDLFPLVSTESGFHVNAFGAGGDTGLAQMTGTALDYANRDFDEFQKAIFQSDNEACVRLAPQVALLEKLKTQGGLRHRCQLIAGTTGPVLSLFYLFIKTKQDQELVESAMERFRVPELMKMAGLESYDHEQLVLILRSLGYNSGATSAVIYLKNFLEMRIEERRRGGARLQKSDFDFRVSIDEGRKIESKINSGKSLSFAEYLWLYQDSGTPGYLNRIAEFSKVLDRSFKEGTCVPESYLSL